MGPPAVAVAGLVHVQDHLGVDAVFLGAFGQEPFNQRLNGDPVAQESRLR